MSSSQVEEEVFESTLWSCAECYVYQIPPLRNESGHRANDWDVNKWLWQGKLQLVATNDTLQIRLLDAATAELFAACPVESRDSKAVDPVVDSSRYFVLRLDDGNGKHAFIGMGFRDRSFAYDFNATMQDHWKSVARQAEADAIRKEAEARAASEPPRDFSLKQGETLSIKVSVAGRADGAGKPRERPAARSPSSGGCLKLPPPPTAALPPPPGAASSPPTVSKSKDGDSFGDFAEADAAGSDGDGEAEDFGDFASA